MHAESYALDTTWRTLLKDLGVAPANVLRRAGLADDLLQQPSVRLDPADYYRLWDSIEAETGDPLFPIRLCQAIRSESLSPPLFAALCSPNLFVAARRISHYKALIAPMRFDVAEETVNVLEVVDRGHNSRLDSGAARRLRLADVRALVVAGVGGSAGPLVKMKCIVHHFDGDGRCARTRWTYRGCDYLRLAACTLRWK